MNAAGQTPRILDRFGSAGADAGRAVGVDTAGNIYVATTFSGTVNFDPNGTKTLTSAGQTDIALLKFAPDGTLVFAVRIGGAGVETVGNMVVDPGGTIYLAGSFSNVVNFDPFGNTPRSAIGGRDIFLAKYSPDGRLRWVVAYGGSKDDEAVDVAVDSNGRIALGCITHSSSIDISPSGGHPFFPDGPVASFFALLTPDAGFINGLPFGSAEDDPNFGLSVAFDLDGNLYAAGSFMGTMQIATLVFIENITQHNDIFIASYTPDVLLRWGYSVGGSGSDNVTSGGLVIDQHSDVFLTGTFESTAYFNSDHNAFPLTSAGGKDIFLAKYNKVGGPVWVEAMGGPQDDVPRRLIADGTSVVYLAGTFRGTAALAPRPTPINFTALGTDGAGDAFCGKYSAGDGSLIWVNTIGAAVSGADNTSDASGIMFDPSGNVTCTGRFFGSPVIEPDGANATLTSSGSSDIFLLRYDSNGRFVKKSPPPPPPQVTINSIVSNAMGVPGPLAPGGIHSIYGSNLTTTSPYGAPAFPLTTSACGIEVKITDSTTAAFKAPIYYCSATQINFVAPAKLARGAARVEVPGTSFAIDVGEATPALYDPAIIYAVGPKTGQIVNDTNRAVVGDILTVFGTGFGAVDPPLPTDTDAVTGLHWTTLTGTAKIGSVTAPVSFYGLTPGYAGLYQLNFSVPAGAGTGKQNLQVQIGAHSSNIVPIYLQ